MTKESFIEEYREGGLCALVEGDIDYSKVPGMFGRKIRSLLKKIKDAQEKLEHLISDEERNIEIYDEELYEDEEDELGEDEE